MESLPTLQEQLAEFARYNAAIWPLQILTYLLAIAAFLAAVRRIRHADRLIFAVLGFYWLWTGVVFIGLGVPGALAVLEGILLLVGVYSPWTSFRVGRDAYAAVGLVFVG